MKKYLELSDIFQEPSLEQRVKDLALRLRSIRKRKKIGQIKLADRSSVSYGSIKRFERTGQIGLASLFRIAEALGVSCELDRLFTHHAPTFEEVLNA